MKHGNSQKGRIPILRSRLAELQGNMSTTEFADKLGLSRQTVGFYLNGERIPDSETLIKICKSCQVSADWLLGIEVEELGLSQKSISTLRNVRDLAESEEMIAGLNMLLEHTRIMFIAKDIKRLADIVQSEQTYSKNFLDDHFDEIRPWDTPGTFMLSSADNLADEIERKIKELYPELSGQFSVICGKAALDARIQGIAEDFKSEVEWITGYLKYLSLVSFGNSESD